MLSEYSGGEIPVVGHVAGPFSTTCRLIETEQVMRMLYKRQEVLELLLDKVTQFLIGWGQAIIENGADIIFLLVGAAIFFVFGFYLLLTYPESSLADVFVSLSEDRRT